IRRVDLPDGPGFRSYNLTLGFEEPAGWEAAVLDHFSALVKTIGLKLRLDQKATRKDETGGSTYHLTLYRGHPMEEEALGELRRFRERFSALRERIDRHNGEHGLPDRRIRLDAYYGQFVIEDGSDEDVEQSF